MLKGYQHPLVVCLRLQRQSVQRNKQKSNITVVMNIMTMLKPIRLVLVCICLMRLMVVYCGGRVRMQQCIHHQQQQTLARLMLQQMVQPVLMM